MDRSHKGGEASGNSGNNYGWDATPNRWNAAFRWAEISCRCGGWVMAMSIPEEMMTLASYRCCIMRLLFNILLLTTCWISGQCQEESIVPGLLREYRDAKADTARSSLLAKISFNLILSDPDSAKLTGEQALLIASRIHDPKSLGDAHHSLGWLAATRGDLDSAEAHMQKALALFQQIGNPVLTAPALGNLGSLAEKRGDDAGALKYFIEALKLAEHAHDSSSMAGLHYSIGVSYRKMGDDDQAPSFLNEALDMERALKRPNKEANCLTSLANVYNQQGDTAKAMGYYGQATEVLTAIGNHRQLGLVEENIGTLFEKSAPERAMTHYMLALAEYNKIGSKEDQAYVMGNIGKLQVDLEDLRQARQMLETGRLLAVEVGAKRLVMDYERTLGELAAKQGDGEATRDHYENYILLRDSLQSADAQLELARLRTAFDTERKEKDNVILRTQNGEQLQRIRIGNLKLYGSIAIGLLLMFSGLAVRKSKQRSDALLQNILPEEVATELIAKGHADARQFENASILFSDFKDFTQLSERMTPHELVQVLNTCFKAFDEIITAHGIEKIKTIGDAYMCVGGLPDPASGSPADVVQAGLDMQAFMAEYSASRNAEGKPAFEMRVGIHTGPVVAGIVGLKKFQYDIWGDTVNIASRMESTGDPGLVNISDTTYRHVKDIAGLRFISRGQVQVKGKGALEMYFVERA